MVSIPRDDNRVPSQFVRESDGETPAQPYVDHTTGELLTKAGSGVETTFDHGRNSDVDAAAEQITTTSVTADQGVVVKAANGNSGKIYVGNSDVTADSTDATDGFELGAGESILIKVNNVNKIYVIASTTNQSVYWMTV